MESGESERQCRSGRISGCPEPILRSLAQSMATMRPPALMWGVVRRGPLGSIDGTAMGTSTQSLQEGIAGSASERTFPP